ncbi:DUF2285 domain-containing protein [Bradyrhizobium sp. Arg68]|uniref:DUF2285 domain-containing protein n=1 Tax=Bradyrhizobium ivorense TaxID=2511166 RepID=UPI0027E27CF5|nr:DUF2285 domain-containing protein [Bradyrhizobium ivorense]MCC8937077.1 DUF2285 domain-containing protein [Bradyrhizobium ivorense]
MATGAASLDPRGFDGADWAWEFLRRNHDYVADWRGAVPRQLPCIQLCDGTQLLRLPRRFPRAERWGLYAFADPAFSARKAPAFWHADALKHLVHLRAVVPEKAGPATAASDPARLCRLADFKVARRAVIDVDGKPLVMMKGRGVHIALAIDGLAVLTRCFAPVYELHGLADLAIQYELLKRLQRFMDDAPGLPPVALPATDERLRQALIALDESLAGKTYRQIAITIFGAKMVAEEWQGASQFLKDRTRRLVAKGTELMKGGYRDLLG